MTRIWFFRAKWASPSSWVAAGSYSLLKRRMRRMRGGFKGADGARSVLVKLKGEKQLLLEIMAYLEKEYIAIPTCQLRKNDRERGYHIFIIVLGRRKGADLR
ncbi:hypothetical protein J7L60_02115 [Candidatus Bathyarchaeota archaeon]|nr:hypothetical protein [Candidatus Bathyarchaeota archaeon]